MRCRSLARAFSEGRVAYVNGPVANFGPYFAVLAYLYIMDIKKKYAYNIGTMFVDQFKEDGKTGPLGKRLEEAKSAGFLSIEVAFPYTWSIDEWEKQLDSYPLYVELINTPLGPNKEPGFASTEGGTERFLEGIMQGIRYCKALKCPRLHIMAGPAATGNESTFVENLQKASELLESEGIVGLIEVISGGVIPGYFLDNFPKAIELLKKIGKDNIKLQFDTFHLNCLGYSTEEIIQLMGENANSIGYIQVCSPTKTTRTPIIHTWCFCKLL
eukprot:sb/3468164/